MRDSEGEEEFKNDKEIELDDKGHSPNKKKLVIMIIVILLVIILIGLIVFLIFFLKSEPECDLGEDSKCLTCDKDKCGSCNYGFVLSEGKCLIHYSFKASYNTREDNQTIDLINFSTNDIKEIYLDNEIIEPSKNYTFKSKGVHKLYVLLYDNEKETLSEMFYNVQNMVSISFSELFNNTEKIKDMSNMFKGCLSLESIDISKFNTQNVIDMSYMFSVCEKLTQIDISSFQTQNVKYMDKMFIFCARLNTVIIGNINTNNLISMNNMFNSCSKLINIDISKIKTNKVEDMSYMFAYCSKLTSINVSNFNTKNVKDINSMFKGCSSLTSIDLSNFDTNNVTNMYNIFDSCSSLSYIDISSFSSSINSTINISDFLSDFGVIKINRNFIKCIKNTIPSNWKIIINSN
jgi:surface protein